MRNYVIINGVNSNTIQGLAINLLPPITKPMMRTQIEEIDGRDGDIITELGYSAYDKEMEIGLWGTYDINQVISFFNGEGTITFSNESDKQYYFKIINQIDYEKLAKFKVATVTFHCQPFKYPLEEDPIEINIQNVTGSGESITLNNTAEAPMKIDLKGNGASVTGDNSIGVCGKNLLPQDKYIATTTINGITYTNNGDGTFNLVGTASANTTIQIIPIGNISLEANQPYYLFSSQPYNATTFNLSIAMTNNGTKFILANGTYTPTATPTNVRLQFYIASGKSVNATNVKLMLVKGSTAPTTYEPYQSQTYEVDLGDIELNTGDSIQYITGKWYIVRANETQEEITDATLIAQLKALANATSYDTVTHITQNANDNPFILNVTAVQKGTDTGIVDNEGNIYSKPTIDIEGSGTVGIYLDGNQMFSVDLSNVNECIIDTASLEAYNPSTSALMNRQVTGDYSNFKLNVGENTVKVSGNVTKATISNYTRWL